jgi:lactate dehydrogenase-like 2-hydroxyacid dehydrogenase
MNLPNVFVTRLIREQGLALLRGQCQLDLWEQELPPDRETLLQRVRGVDGLLCLLSDRIDAEVMDAAGENLKVISNHAVGFDNVDLQAARQRGIKVGNTPGILTDATADFAFALMLAAARRVVEAERMVRRGGWKTWGPSILLGADLVGATLGVVGFGRIGQAVARRARGFDMRVLYTDPTDKESFPELNAVKVDFETLLQQSDFISLHTPLTAETRHLIDRRALSLMKPTAVLVNTARGGVIDQEALYQALHDRQIFAAALDVTDPEPLPMDSPLLELDNLVIAPHIASASFHSRDQMAVLAAQNLLAGLRGEPLPYAVA